MNKKNTLKYSLSKELKLQLLPDDASYHRKSFVSQLFDPQNDLKTLDIYICLESLEVLWFGHILTRTNGHRGGEKLSLKYTAGDFPSWMRMGGGMHAGHKNS